MTNCYKNPIWIFKPSVNQDDAAEAARNAGGDIVGGEELIKKVFCVSVDSVYNVCVNDIRKKILNNCVYLFL